MDAIQVETVIDGVSVGKGGSPSLAGGALESVRFLLEHCARWGRPLTAGTLVSTGAVTGFTASMPAVNRRAYSKAWEKSAARS